MSESGDLEELKRVLDRLKAFKHFAEFSTKFSTARSRIVRELYVTELTYIKALNQMMLWLRPTLLKASSNDKKLCAALFSNMQELLDTHSVLMAQLQPRMHRWSDCDTRIGDIVVSLLDRMRSAYLVYGVGHAESARLLAQLKDSAAKKDKQIVAQLKRVPAVADGQSVQSVLIMPIQRVPRLMMLLGDLKRKTETSHVDYEDIERAEKALAELASDINVGVQCAEETRAAKEIRGAIAGLGAIVDEPERQLIVADSAMLIDLCDPQSGHVIETLEHAVLFSDQLLLAKNCATATPATSGDDQNDDDDKAAAAASGGDEERAEYALPAAPRRADIFAQIPLHALWVDVGSSRLSVKQEEIERGPAIVLRTPGAMFRVQKATRLQRELWQSELTQAIDDVIAERKRPLRSDAEHTRSIRHFKHVYAFGSERGEQFDGVWLNARPHSFGSHEFANGDVYIGEVSNGLPTGRGQIKFVNDGGIYDGEFRKGLPHGHGRMAATRPVPGTYEGEFYLGMKQGQGTVRWQFSSSGVAGKSSSSPSSKSVKLSSSSSKKSSKRRLKRNAYARSSRQAPVRRSTILASPEAAKALLATIANNGKELSPSSSPKPSSRSAKKKRRKRKPNNSPAASFASSSAAATGASSTDDNNKNESVNESENENDGEDEQAKSGMVRAAIELGNNEERAAAELLLHADEEAVYSGQWSRNRMHGRGRYLSRHFEYSGDYVHGRRTGEGTTVTASDNSLFVGTFLNDLYHGRGRWQSAQESYEGQWRNGLRHGLGKLADLGRSIEYVGHFKHGLFHGLGEFKTERGAIVYKGSFSFGVKSGSGVQVDRIADTTYDGQFEHGNYHGSGKLGGSDIGTYVGDFEHGRRHGRGRQVFPNGDVYDGLWKHNLFHGKGKLSRSNADPTTGAGPFAYDGQWKHGRFNGTATLIDASGAFTGEFLHGAREGTGQFTSHDGLRHAGSWHDDCRHGAATIQSASMLTPTATEYKDDIERRATPGSTLLQPIFAPSLPPLKRCPTKC
jgi:hypothetical protein